VKSQKIRTERGDIFSKTKHKNSAKQTFLHADLIDQLNPKNPSLQLARKIDWSVFENEFGPLYSDLM
jgi:hypothetical protein